MPSRPLLPKALASRIRAAQKKIAEAHLDIVINEERVEQCRAELEEFSTNPEMFARKHFGNHGVDSYPVVTRIGRCKEDLAYRIERIQGNLVGLIVAEENLATAEIEVIQALSGLQPNTKGRIPWPESPSSLDQFLDEFKRERDQFERASTAQQEIDGTNARTIDCEMQARHELEWQQLRDSMSLEERVAAAEWMDRIKVAIEAGEMSFGDLLQHLQKKRNESGR